MKIYNHQIFVDANGRNELNIGNKIMAEGFLTEINQDKFNIEFSFIEEHVTLYELDSNSKKTEVVDKLEHININFNPKKVNVDIDDILDKENGGKEKLKFIIKGKKEMHFICITDKSVLEKNYIFVDELAVSQSH
jgi:hypothetical protein